MKIRAAVIVLLALSGVVSARGMTLDDLQSMQDSFVELDVSPTGRWLAESKADQLTIRRLRDGKLVRNIGQGIMPKWSPGESKLAFYSVRSGTLQLWMWDARQDSLTQLTNIANGVDPDPNSRVSSYLIGDAFLFDWSPDETYIVFASRVPVARERSATAATKPWQTAGSSPGAPRILTSDAPSDFAIRDIFIHRGFYVGLLQSPDGRSLSNREAHPDEELFNQLWTIELGSRRTLQITHGRESSFHPAWSPVGDSIAYVTVPGPVVQLSVPVAASELKVIDLATGRARTIETGPGIRSRPHWSPDGSRLSFLSAASAYDWQRLNQVDFADERSPVSSISFDRFIYSDYEWSHDGAGWLVRYRDGQSTRLARIDGKTGTVVDIIPKADYPISVGLFTQSAQGLIVWRQKDPVRLASVKYLTGPGKPVSTFEIEAAGAERFELGKTERVRWTNSRGEQLEGAVLLPPGYTQNERYPMIVDAYPLQTGVDWLSPMGGNYGWASAGYVVFRPAPRAPHAWVTGWKSRAFSEAGKGAQGWAVAVDDVMSGVDSLIERGLVDAGRMCLYGFSNGGGVVNHLVTKTHRFRCAVSVAPGSANWVRPTLWQSDHSVESATGGLKFAGGLTIERDLSELVEMSSVFHLSSVRTPMLIAVGDDDATDFLLDSIELYQGVRRQNPAQEVTLLRYPSQGHGFAGDSLRDFWWREMKFFETYLSEGSE